MRKIITFAIAAVGLITALSGCSSSKDVVGSWQLFDENGERQSGYAKNYKSNGTFTVSEQILLSSDDYENHQVKRYTESVVQRGTWETPKKNTIIEKCQMGNKGDVKIAYKVKGNILTEDFSYAANPEQKYTQKFHKVEDIATKQRKPREIKLKHAGTFGGDPDKIVFIIDGKRYPNAKAFNKALPDEVGQVENILVNKSADVYNYMTEEEIAAGKNAVVIATLKK